MGNLKNKWVKPGGSFNYTEAQRVKGAEDIATNDILVITGMAGGIGIVSKADCGSLRTSDGRLLIAKHAIPAGGYGVGLPWALISDWDTGNGSGGAGTLGEYWLVGGAAAGLGGAGKMINMSSAEGSNIIGGAANVRPIAKTIAPSSADGVADGSIYMAVETPT